MLRLVQYINDTATPPATVAYIEIGSTVQQSLLCEWLPSLWFCHRDPGPEPDPDLLAVAGMLNALRTAADTFTPDIIEHTAISLPYREWFSPPTNRSAFISSAAKYAGLKKPALYHPFAGEAAARANGIGDCRVACTCDDKEPDPMALVLMVEYSTGALTTALMTTEFGEFEEVRVETALNLGADSRSQFRSEEEYWLAVEAQIRRVAQVPTSDPRAPQEIAHLVLYGDSTHSAHFQAVLRDTLTPDLLLKPTSSAKTDDGNSIIDPVFAAAQGATAFAWPWCDFDAETPQEASDYAESQQNRDAESFLSCLCRAPP